MDEAIGLDGDDGGGGLALLLWDAPNLDMSLGKLLGARPTSQQRPRFDALAQWLVDEAGSHDAEATIFTNVAPGSASSIRGWVEAVRSFGYAVFAKPKLRDDDDIDDAMLDHLERRHEEGRLREVYVASGDGRNFREPLEDLARQGVAVHVLGFAEHASYALQSGLIAFVDLEDVPGVFPNLLPRTRLEHLPPEGRWLPPTRPLSALRARAGAPGSDGR